MTSGVIGNIQGYQKQQLPSQRSHYSNNHPNKRRRATTSASKTSTQSQHIPPTPTSATQPPAVHTQRPSDAGSSESNPSPGDTRASTDSNVPPCTSPVSNPSLNPPNLGGGGLSLPFSPNFSFSPLPQFASLAPSPVPRPANLNQNQDNHTVNFDPVLSMPPPPYDQQPTPGAGSTSGASAHTDPDSKDPFLSLLEQLAENEVSRGGPSELDFFLSGQSG
jgi:hypothetical protein